ncbi:MAG: protein-L-isoaspartate(D-aspartate) O-methyltransferase [Candidatus Bathyarchaeota archaeon]|nr:protein-L-isoaspartate(D-aspartate) O-methyltransferase [Candidatus Bathyarchaeota archaeon]
MTDTNFEAERRRLVNYLVKTGILRNEHVIKAMLKVPREEFIPKHLKNQAYEDTPLPIGCGQTISAPHMVAMMCEFLELRVGDKVLEVGAGSGYHAAVIAEIVAPEEAKNPGHVYTIELVEELADFARKNLEKTSYKNRVTVFHGDGTLGLPEYAPFDRIIVTAAAPSIPTPLIKQLADDGILIIPLGEPHLSQVLKRVVKVKDALKCDELCSVVFVPLRGKYGWKG